MKKYIVIILAGIFTVQAKAQQLQTSSLYDLQSVYHNPSMAGTQAMNMVGVSYRTQWSGISGSPKRLLCLVHLAYQTIILELAAMFIATKPVLLHAQV